MQDYKTLSRGKLLHHLDAKTVPQSRSPGIPEPSEFISIRFRLFVFKEKVKKKVDGQRWSRSKTTESMKKHHQDEKVKDHQRGPGLPDK